jgi:hypothetical protein
MMGGGCLFATFSTGPIYADFEAWASFLINFKPFFLVAEIGIGISVGIDIHIDSSTSALAPPSVRTCTCRVRTLAAG